MRAVHVLSWCVAAVTAGVVTGSAMSHPSTKVDALAQGAHAPPRCVSHELTLSLGPIISPMTGEHADLFQLTNVSTQSCTLDGYPRVTLSDDGERLPFVYRNGGGPYVTGRAPQRVTVPPGRRAYFLVAKYRCDGGVLHTATSIRVLLPATTTGGMTLTLREPGVREFDYCKRYPGDQPIDPGNRVTVSPIAASTRATAPPL